VEVGLMVAKARLRKRNKRVKNDQRQEQKKEKNEE
jgi:hypothetical protein